MAENAKSTVSQSVASQSTRKEISSRWKYRYNFCREIGVKFLYGDKLRKVPEKELSIMLGACIENSSNPLVVVLAIMRVLVALTREPFMDRPMYSIRQRMRRTSAKYILARVLYYLASVYADDHDAFVDVIMDILLARKEFANELVNCDEQYDENEFNDDENNDSIKIEFQGNCEDSLDEEDWIDDDESEQELIVIEDEAPEPEAQEGTETEPSVVFLDAAALKEYQNYAIVGTPEQKKRLREMRIILPGPAFRDIDAADPLAWADIIRENFGLNITVEYLGVNALPWLATSIYRSGLSKGDYYIVKYAVYFSQLIPGLRVDCATPGVMELYESEMAMVRMLEGAMHNSKEANS